MIWVNEIRVRDFRVRSEDIEKEKGVLAICMGYGAVIFMENLENQTFTF